MDTTIQTERDKGFTLIELLIVIVILGILATVTVFAVSGITNRGETSACAAERKTVEAALEAHFAQLNAYPQGADDAARGQALVSAGFLRTPPTKYTISSNAGAISPVAPCT